MSLPECVEVEPEGGAADAAVIWLHGLGADGRDFLPILPYLELPVGHRVRFIFPNAPLRSVTANGGWPMPAWYDIPEFSFPRRIDPYELEEADGTLMAVLHRELERGIDSSRVVVAGFSQGGAVALHAGLQSPVPLAGILALSCYLPLEPATWRTDVPVLLLHGQTDAMVPLAEAKATLSTLHINDVPVRWRSWPMGHEVIPEEAQMIGAWLRERLPPL